MKNVLTLSLLTAGIAFSSSILAQEPIKAQAASTATQLETPKTDSKTAKQDPVKAPTGSDKTSSKTEKTEGKAVDTTHTTDGKTRMAISEQGVPKKVKGKKASTAPPAETPPKK